MAEMDDDFASGRIPETRYRSERGELKEVLLDLTRRTGAS
jgi:hypothetical protein